MHSCRLSLPQQHTTACHCSPHLFAARPARRGSNHLGQLGTGSILIGIPTPTAVFGSTKFARLEAGGVFTCGLERDTGIALCWG